MIWPIRVVGVTAVTISTTAAAIPSAYLAAITIAALIPHRRRPRPTTPLTRFVIMVPAHDEVAVIREALEAFDRLDYPDDLFSVHVVADNCTDATVEVVQSTRWTVHPRDEPDDRGKGPALNWLYDRLAAGGGQFDAAVIVDADTSLDSSFLRAMDGAFQDGARVAQGYYSVRGHDSSPVASFRFAALACRHRLRPLGRTRLGGSAGLYGNGMMFDWPLLADHRWSGHLAEDAELQNELLLRGQRVTFAPEAVLRAEIPHTAAAARSQNERWERGRLELARRYVPRLVSGFPRARGQRIAYADAALDHLVPPLSVLITLQLAAVSVAGVGALGGHRPSRIAAFVDMLSIGIVVAHTVAGLASAGADMTHYRALLGAPSQIVWKVRLWLAMLDRRREVTWTRTTRNVGTTGRCP